jgi:long-chain acyl-CoA synthetase
VHRRRHLAELLLDARRFPERDYLVMGDRRITFADQEKSVLALACHLQDRGVRPKDRVLLFAHNSPEWVVAFWAIMRSGAVVVLGNAWWSEQELSYAVNVTQPRLVLTDERHASSIPEHQERVILAEVAKAAAPRADPESPAPADEDDPAVILFTSGTTGLPKGAVLSHRGIIATLQALLNRTRRLPQPDSIPPPASRSMLSLPLFHVGGLQLIITSMVTGGLLVFTEGRFDPEAVVRLICEEDINVWSTVPTMATRVIQFLENTGHPPVEQLRTLGLGGSPVLEQLRRQVAEWFPNVSRGLAVTYGLSEAGGVVATGAGPMLASRPSLVGKPLDVITVRIDDPNDDGEGEVLVQAPSVMLGYWTAESAKAGGDLDSGPIDEHRWLHTGDVGRLDDEGYLYITDRTKDIVIRGGENIAAPHIESRLLEHPDVRECAVFGLPHPTLGEEVGAVVVLRESAQVSAAELAEHAAATLAYFEVPSRWKLQTEPLPQNATGKILKRSIRQSWLDEMAAADSPGAGR